MSRLFPNLGVSGEGIRRFYTTVVRYGAPVWWRDFRESGRFQEHPAANGLIRRYRTIALEATLALTGTPPWELKAEARAEMHTLRARAVAAGGQPTPRALTLARVQARQSVCSKDGRRLSKT